MLMVLVGRAERDGWLILLDLCFQMCSSTLSVDSFIYMFLLVSVVCVVLVEGRRD